MSDNSKRNKLLLLAGGAVVAAGAALYFMRGDQAEPEPVIVKKKPSAAAADAPAAAKAPEASTAASAPAAAASDNSLKRETTTAMVNEYSFDGGDNKATHDPKKDQVRVYQPPVPDANGVIFFDSVGVRVQLSRGWSASEESTPMPNVAMLSFTKAEYADRPQTGMPGETPVVLLSIEDISNEGISVDEFRERSKAMALGQMQMMTNGMFRPNVEEDAKLDTPIGPFTHTLIYELNTPMFNMKVMNLTCVIEGLAYILQVMAQGRDFLNVRKEVISMAKTAAIERRGAPADFRTVSSTTVVAEGGCAAIPPAWSLEKSSKSNPVFRFVNASQSRAENIEVHDASADNAMDLSKPVAKGEKTIRDVTVTDYGSNLRVAKKGNVIVAAMPKHSGAVVTSPEVLASIAESVSFENTAPKPRLTFHSTALQLAFEMSPKARLIESRVSERIAVYAPEGLPKEPSDEVPMLTIRVGDPSNDPDCRTSYAEWMHRIKEEAEGDSIAELKKDTIAGQECVSFLNKEMQEVGPGMKEERTAKVIIMLKGVRTTMLRWETSSGSWRKHEKKLSDVVESLRLD